MVQIPRVAAGAKVRALRRAGDAEFGGVGAAHEHRPGGAIAPGQAAVLGIDHVAGEAAAVAVRPAGHGDAEILDQERHARERTVGRARPGRRAGFVVGLVDDGVERRIVPLDALDRRLDRLDRRHLARRDQAGETDAVMIGIVVETHARALEEFSQA